MLLTIAITAATLLTETITFSCNVAREAITFSSNAQPQFPGTHASLDMPRWHIHNITVPEAQRLPVLLSFNYHTTTGNAM